MADAAPRDASEQTSGTAARDAVETAIAEGEHRLERGWPSLLSAATVGGFDVAVGVFALLVVRESSGNELVASVAFSIGFVVLTLANSELFTENFLIPVAALIAGRSRPPAILRLWFVTLVANLAGGAVAVVLVVDAFPKLGATAVEIGAHYPSIGIGWRSFSGAMLGGALVTLMTWMHHTHDSPGAKIVAAAVVGFLLAAGPVNHVIVAALEMFAALLHGAPFGYADLAASTGWFALGNLVGGVALVTGLRLVQAGGETDQLRR